MEFLTSSAWGAVGAVATLIQAIAVIFSVIYISRQISAERKQAKINRTASFYESIYFTEIKQPLKELRLMLFAEENVGKVLAEEERESPGKFEKTMENLKELVSFFATVDINTKVDIMDRDVVMQRSDTSILRCYLAVMYILPQLKKAELMSDKWLFHLTALAAYACEFYKDRPKSEQQFKEAFLSQVEERLEVAIREKWPQLARKKRLPRWLRLR